MPWKKNWHGGYSYSTEMAVAMRAVDHLYEKVANNCVLKVNFRNACAVWCAHYFRNLYPDHWLELPSAPRDEQTIRILVRDLTVLTQLMNHQDQPIRDHAAFDVFDRIVQDMQGTEVLRVLLYY